MMESGNTLLPLTIQCRLLNLSRSSYYYQPRTETELNLRLMELIDKQYIKRPFFWSPANDRVIKKAGLLD